MSYVSKSQNRASKSMNEGLGWKLTPEWGKDSKERIRMGHWKKFHIVLGHIKDAQKQRWPTFWPQKMKTLQKRSIKAHHNMQHLCVNSRCCQLQGWSMVAAVVKASQGILGKLPKREVCGSVLLNRWLCLVMTVMRRFLHYFLTFDGEIPCYDSVLWSGVASLSWYINAPL